MTAVEQYSRYDARAMGLADQIELLVGRAGLGDMAFAVNGYAEVNALAGVMSVLGLT